LDVSKTFDGTELEVLLINYISTGFAVFHILL